VYWNRIFNKVYSVLESTSKSIEEIEVDKYLNKDKDFRNNSCQQQKAFFNYSTGRRFRNTETDYLFQKYYLKTQLPISKKETL
jgi:two-component system phosphate regulon sensor histidine kinase PhoR